MLKSKADLYSLVRRYAPRGSLSVKTLRESWPQVGPAIEELEREGKIFVTRSGKSTEREGQMKSVFLNEIGEKCTVDKGQSQADRCPLRIRADTSRAEFCELWHSLKTPIADELAAELRAGEESHRNHYVTSRTDHVRLYTAGLNAASSVSAPVVAVKKKGKGRKGPGSSNRRLKITNTHLKGQIDLTKDFTPGGR